MSHLFKAIPLLSVVSLPLMAGTVVITSVPDAARQLQPLTSLNGVPLAAGTSIRVGAFPGLSDDQVLDLASQGGITQLNAAFIPFGNPCVIGQGVDGSAGSFEIAVKASGTAAPWITQTVSLLIQTTSGEFLVARFPGKIFEADSATGLEPLLSLHLADAKLIVGNRPGVAALATSLPPAVGSFSTWLAGFSSIIDPALMLPSADADHDGRSNFLEYATGGNPASSNDIPPCRISPATNGGMWIHFNRVAGLGSILYTLQSSGEMTSPWLEAAGVPEPDPENPAVIRLHVAAPLPVSHFFRLNVKSVP